MRPIKCGYTKPIKETLWTTCLYFVDYIFIHGRLGGVGSVVLHRNILLLPDAFNWLSFLFR